MEIDHAKYTNLIVDLFGTTVEQMRSSAFEEAIPNIQRLIFECPYEGVFHQMHAEALNALDRPEEATDAARRSLALAPQNPDALYQAAVSYLALGNPAAAVVALDRALVLSPNRPMFRWHRAFANLQLYRFAEGFEDYEYGYVHGGPRRVRCPINKIWNGEPTEVLFVHSEQGLGDQIQFARFLRLAKERAGGMLVLECAPELLGFLEGCADLTVAARDGSIPVAYTRWVSIVSLPHILGVREITGEPYFGPPKLELPEFEAKVGFVWSGNPNHANNKDRSLSAEEAKSFEGLAPFAALQPWDDLPFEMPRLSGPDIGYTAAVIDRLDLVVTVDTSIAHIAGSMGKETWLIAPRKGEWRWGTEGRRSPWYDSIEIFRSVNRDRSGAITEVQDRLRERYRMASSATARVEKPSRAERRREARNKGKTLVPVA